MQDITAQQYWKERGTLKPKAAQVLEGMEVRPRGVMKKDLCNKVKLELAEAEVGAFNR